MDDNEYWSGMTRETKQISNCEIQVTYRSPSGETERFNFNFYEKNYCLSLGDSILIKLPDLLGRWLFNRGLAVENYVGLAKIPQEKK